MAQDKKQLEALLHFIDRLIAEPGNEWFAEELQKRYGKPKEPINVQDSPKIGKIEHYLGLDFELDEAEISFDYSFIYDDDIRTKLECDYREMLRYRYGVRSHKIDFEEFCRYANLQIEMLINYFYEQVDETLPKIKEHLIKYQEIDSFRKTIASAKSLGAITLLVKTFAFTNEFNLKSLSFQLSHLREVRNQLSHRGGNDDLNLSEYRKELISEGYILNSNGEIFLNNPLIKKDTETYNKHSLKRNEEKYKKYEQEIWRNREPFEEVVEMIKITAQTVCNNI